MATQVVNPVTEVKKTVKRTVEHPFSGKEIERTANYTLPLATDLNSASSIAGGKEEELVFWFNYGRRIAAHNQAIASLAFDMGSDELNQLKSSLDNAMKNLVGKDTSDDDKKRYRDFFLSEKKFAPLRDKLNQIEAEGFGDKDIDYSTVTLEHPSFTRGRKKKVVAENGETQEVESEDEGEE